MKIAANKLLTLKNPHADTRRQTSNTYFFFLYIGRTKYTSNIIFKVEGKECRFRNTQEINELELQLQTT